MKRMGFLWMLMFLAWSGMSQFVLQPLNYPAPGYWPLYISISDPEHVWIGSINENDLPFPFSARTTDGGDSWTFDSIPVPGVPFCSSICQWDSNTCFFVFTDWNIGGGSIWKTTDGGDSWTNLTTTQFTGGFANFYHAFSADTGVAVGDPTNGYFEIQQTNNGGLTWNRVPPANIPVILPDESGINDAYSAVGNSIWFATNKGRCYRSSNRGSDWEVSEILPGGNGRFGTCFSSRQTGAFWHGDAIISDIVVTTDGGITWDSIPWTAGRGIVAMSRVPGFESGFIFTAWGNYLMVYFTPDMFTNAVMIDYGMTSIGSIAFLDASTGWLGGGESGTNEIYKFTGVLTSAREAMKEPGRISIVPNPSSGEALVKVPSAGSHQTLGLRVTDMAGKVVFSSRFEASTGWTKLDAASYANGMYILEILSDNMAVGRERWVVSR